MRFTCLFTLFLLYHSLCVTAQPVYVVESGNISFHSDAPQELIKASSDKITGIFDAKKKIFAFRINIISFMGFNSPLQREHFNENYMESSIYPQAVYQGKIIEDIDFTNDGVYTIRSKGKLTIHGIGQERIINASIICKGDMISIRSDFIVSLADHKIKIPRVVYDKLAQDINISVNLKLVPKQ
jgi:YceI-like domain.